MNKSLIVAAFLPLVGICIVPACAQTLYYDDFQQFPNGTVLTSTNYTPVSGPSGDSALFFTNLNGFGFTSVRATNLLGSTRAFFDLGSVPYANNYVAQLQVPQTNQVLQIQSTLWIQSVKAATATGGFEIALLKAGDAGISPQDGSALILFADSGHVIAFTNDPAFFTSFTVIGTWSNYVGKVMTNNLVLNYPARSFSFSINGTTLTNLPLWAGFTNLFSKVRFEATEELDTSAGNRFALGNVQVARLGLWSGATDEGGGLKYLAWFGYFTPFPPGNWIWHYEHGWLYCVGTDTSSLWLWCGRLNSWLWTSDSVYPFLWSSAGSAWLWYYKGTGNTSGGWFYNYGTGQVEWK